MVKLNKKKNKSPKKSQRNVKKGVDDLFDIPHQSKGVSPF